MTSMWTKLAAACLASFVLAGCTPLIVGGAAVVIADEAVEQDQGGDGLF